MPPVQQHDLAKAEQRMVGQAQIVLAVVDGISRSSACHGMQVETELVANILQQLTRLELPSGENSSGDDLFDLSHEPLNLPLSNAHDNHGWTLSRLLKQLSSFQQHREEFAVIRHTAHQALAYRELQQRFVERLEQVKLQSIYNLAYGLSHELNNPLANIASRAGLLLQAVKSSEHVSLVQAIVDNAMRGGEMLGDLMLIARPPQLSAKEVCLDELAAEITERCSHWASRRQVVIESTWNATGIALVDRTMLIETVWCLVRNAIEASEPNSTVTILGSLSQASLIVEVLDNGPGLSSEALQHCFDPFFSGREAGRGLGMGLAKAKRFAELMGGDIRITNRAGRGCQAIAEIPVERKENEANV